MGEVEKNESGTRPDLFEEVIGKLRSGGLSVEEFREKRSLTVVPGVTLERYIVDLVNSLTITEKDGVLVLNAELDELREQYHQARGRAEADTVRISLMLGLREYHDSHF